jgi:general secretion pathway protein A
MYEQFFGLRERPFSLVPDPHFLLLTRQHGLALTMLQYGLTRQSMISVLTGEVGSGKTTLVRHLLSDMEPDVRVALVDNTPDRSAGLMRWIAVALDLPADGLDAAGIHRRLADLLAREARAGRRVLLILDEAQNLSSARLEELRVLTNLNVGRDLVLQVMLVGQPELRQKLRQPRLRQFVQRVAVDYHLGTLDRQETSDYVAHRLATAGGRVDLITDDAVGIVHDHSGGVPRLVNQLCDMALVYGYAEQRAGVDGELMRRVVNDRIGGGIFPSAVASAGAGNLGREYG